VKVPECAREREVLQAVLHDRWPDGCDDELRSHAAGCAVCREVAEVAGMLRDDQTAALHDARIPSAAHVWWRSQIRVRQEAVRTVSRPMTVVQGIGAATAVGLAAGAVTIGWREGGVSGESMRTWASGVADQVLGLAVTAPQATLVLGAVVACLILMPVAVYFALSDPKA
jgi:hypothetical protein